eukprot:TRINITY_DN12585_c0_g1_i1.p1 TRINITY_DN12585_c0_g1~~TRINITY_DN12585_c0_g1_i1.p1  ORF type:complete len:611 (-),score=99.02 TRINITY_DN12585_c0_g1_i1:25-1857(-)
MSVGTTSPNRTSSLDSSGSNSSIRSSFDKSKICKVSKQRDATVYHLKDFKELEAPLYSGNNHIRRLPHREIGNIIKQMEEQTSNLFVIVCVDLDSPQHSKSMLNLVFEPDHFRCHYPSFRAAFLNSQEMKNGNEFSIQISSCHENRNNSNLVFVFGKGSHPPEKSVLNAIDVFNKNINLLKTKHHSLQRKDSLTTLLVLPIVDIQHLILRKKSVRLFRRCLQSEQLMNEVIDKLFSMLTIHGTVPEGENLHLTAIDRLSYIVSRTHRLTESSKEKLKDYMAKSQFGKYKDWIIYNKLLRCGSDGENVSEDNIEGEGSFSSVYRHEISRSEVVAIKKLRSQRTELRTPNDIKRFGRELHALASLEHKNIVKLHWVNPEAFTFCLEYCETSLYHVLHPEKFEHQRFKIDLTPLIKLYFASDVSEGLAFLHSKNIIHRDIKPENVLLKRFEERVNCQTIAKICDFGDCRHIDNTDKTLPVGTGAYMAPEIIDRDRKYDQSVDVYSYGVLLWQIMHLKVPRDELMKSSESARIRAKKKELAIELEIDPDICSPEIISLIEKCFKKEPSNRPKSDTLRDTLRGIIVNILDTKTAETTDSENCGRFREDCPLFSHK